MSATKITFDIVRKIGLALPDVEESTAYGAPALKVRGSLLACLPVNKSAEPESLAVAMDFEQRAALLAEAPETYYVTDHYAGYPVVLVRMSRIRIKELRDLLGAAWRFVVTAQKPNHRKIPMRSICEPSRRTRRPDQGVVVE